MITTLLPCATLTATVTLTAAPAGAVPARYRLPHGEDNSLGVSAYGDAFGVQSCLSANSAL